MLRAFLITRSYLLGQIEYQTAQSLFTTET